jgi:cytochrome bd ubiquinol oxidase subunit I
MELDPVFLSRLQFALRRQLPHHLSRLHHRARRLVGDPRGTRLATGNPVYRRVFDFWLKVFALSLGMGVVKGIVRAFQFGAN